MFVLPSKADASGAEPIYHGYLLRDGHKATIRKGWRTVVRNASNHIVSTQIEAEDENGRTLKISGEAASRMMLSVPHGTCRNSFLYFTFESGTVGHGGH